MTPRLHSPATLALATGLLAFCVGCDQPAPLVSAEDASLGGGAAGPGGQGGDAGQTKKKPPFWTEGAAKNPYQLKEWYGDFPYPLEMPKVVRPGRWYNKASGQALQGAQPAAPEPGELPGCADGAAARPG